MASQYKTFSANAVLTASDVNAYLMKQAVIVCDSSADYPSAPNEGMVVYDKNLDSLVIYDGSNWIQSLAVAGGGDSTWTPTLTQSSTVAATVGTAKYIRQGSLITAWCYLDVTGTGSSGSAITVSLPVTAAGMSVNDCIGSGLVVDNGTAVYPAAVNLSTTSTVVFGGGNASGGNIGGAPAFALASGDNVRFTVQYLAA